MGFEEASTRRREAPGPRGSAPNFPVPSSTVGPPGGLSPRRHQTEGRPSASDRRRATAERHCAGPVPKDGRGHRWPNRTWELASAARRAFGTGTAPSRKWLFGNGRAALRPCPRYVLKPAPLSENDPSVQGRSLLGDSSGRDPPGVLAFLEVGSTAILSLRTAAMNAVETKHFSRASFVLSTSVYLIHICRYRIRACLETLGVRIASQGLVRDRKNAGHVSRPTRGMRNWWPTRLWLGSRPYMRRQAHSSLYSPGFVRPSGPHTFPNG